MAQKFKIGDQVMLKSGGPTMTIDKDKLGSDLSLGKVFNETYECVWFQGDELVRGRFNEESLQLVAMD